MMKEVTKKKRGKSKKIKKKQGNKQLQKEERIKSCLKKMEARVVGSRMLPKASVGLHGIIQELIQHSLFAAMEMFGKYPSVKVIISTIKIRPILYGKDGKAGQMDGSMRQVRTFKHLLARENLCNL